MVEVTGGEWSRGRTNTSKVRNPRGTVLTEGEQPLWWGMLAEGEYPRSLTAGSPRGGVLVEGEHSCSPREGSPATRAPGRAAHRGRVAPGGTPASGEQLRGPCSPPLGPALPCSLGVSSPGNTPSMVLVSSPPLSSRG